ncbi:hypothetical protein PIB30_034163 [Stylosanthes scabra]|uniref:Uncharacterized protein n=1 Tax=Stylosanthes scabra TaxID=79078 RepID=A0ABU6YB43_9FABA|nr:hypothetical protein [Stylosanthes scabra]
MYKDVYFVSVSSTKRVTKCDIVLCLCLWSTSKHSLSDSYISTPLIYKSLSPERLRNEHGKSFMPASFKWSSFTFSISSRISGKYLRLEQPSRMSCSSEGNLIAGGKLLSFLQYVAFNILSLFKKPTEG